MSSGTAGTAPTARMKRRARIVTSPAESVSRSVKRALPLDHADAEGGQPLGRDIGRDGRGDGAEVLADLGEIDLERRPGDAHGRAAAEQIVDLGGGEQRLGRNRPGGEVGAAHRGLFDQDHGHALGDGGQRGGDAPRAAADDANVGCQLFRHSPSDSAAETVAMIVGFR